MRVAKIVLGAVAALVALLVVAVVIVASTFDPNDYKGVATDAFTARTGRTLTIDEDLRLAYFPWLAVETGGVTIGNAPDFGGAAQPFATARRVAARVKLLPLLSRRVEIGTVELEGLTLNLARDASLRGNWQDLARNRERAASRAPSRRAGAASIDELAIEGVRISDGNVYWRENTDELRYSVTGLSLTTGGIGSGEPVDFEAALDFADETSGLKATLAAGAVVATAANGTVTATDFETSGSVNGGNGAPARRSSWPPRASRSTAQAETLAVEGLATEIAGIRAAWQLTATALLANPTLRGSVAVDAAELAAVFEQLGCRRPLRSSRASSARSRSLRSSSSKPNRRSCSVREVDAELLGMRVNGEGSLDGGNELAGRIVDRRVHAERRLQACCARAVPPTVDVERARPLALDTRFDTNLDYRPRGSARLQAEAFGATVSGNLEALPRERGNVFRGAVTTSRFASEAIREGVRGVAPAEPRRERARVHRARRPVRARLAPRHADRRTARAEAVRA